MTRLILSALLAALPGLVDAQAMTGEKLVVAKCGDRGCSCTLSDIDAETLDLLLGPGLPPDAIKRTLVILDDDAILSPLTPDEVDLAAGGDGKCELALFNPITPRDGTWQGSVRVQSVTGCLPQVGAMVPPLVDGMGNSQRIAWGGQFHPQKLATGHSPAVSWSERSPGRFTGRIQGPATGVIAVGAGLTATLTSPDHATATMRLRIAAAPGADKGALAAIGMADCRTHAVYDFRRIGD